MELLKKIAINTVASIALLILAFCLIAFGKEEIIQVNNISNTITYEAKNDIVNYFDFNSFDYSKIHNIYCETVVTGKPRGYSTTSYLKINHHNTQDIIASYETESSCNNTLDKIIEYRQSKSTKPLIIKNSPIFLNFLAIISLLMIIGIWTREFFPMIIRKIKRIKNDLKNNKKNLY